jgi:hypothetical protein
VPIRKSSAASIDALTADLASASAVTREAAIARLTVIGARAVESLVSVVGRAENGPTARLAAIRALEALADERAIDTALGAALDEDPGVAAGAVALAGVFLTGRRDPAVLDRLTTIALDCTRPETVRLAAVAAVSDLNPATLRPLWAALATDPSAAIRERVGAGPVRSGPEAVVPARAQLNDAAEAGLPEHAETLRRLLNAGGTTAPLPAIHRIIERLREREAAVPAPARAEWTRARGTAHIALAKRSSRIGLYDLREALEGASAPLPVEFLAALSIAGDASCLEAIAAAHGRATDTWWRQHLADTFQAIVAREGLTRRHAVMRKIEKRWGASRAGLSGPRKGRP